MPLNQIQDSGAARRASFDLVQSNPPVGLWPEPTSRWSVIGAGCLWTVWVAFLIWMIVLRLQSSP